jgi:hypothetical protein
MKVQKSDQCGENISLMSIVCIPIAIDCILSDPRRTRGTLLALAGGRQGRGNCEVGQTGKMLVPQM